ncbi:MAG: hypothetical protein VKO26_08520 [Cyanobacteriota bacterium]|nr:hypothetical protein [Cyanobacteriota bacterium]
MHLVARSARSVFARASIAVSFIAGGVFGLSLPAQAIRPAYTATERLGSFYDQGSQSSSFGFYFDTTIELPIDALGFAPQEGWPGGSSAYTVSVWAFQNGGLNPGDYVLKAQSIFTPGNTYVIQDGWCWQSIVPVVLPETYNSDPTNQRGYVIAATGNFKNQPGNVKYESGIPNIDPNFNFGGNAFGDSTASAAGFFPIPTGENPALGINAFFNPNLSYVPGPAPILGVAGALGVARKLRHRIRLTKQS